MNPYIPLAAKGPWIVTSHGGVVYDTGGYGMLGFGQNPDNVLKTLANPVVMANIMTPSFSQQAFKDAIRKEIGHTRNGSCPYESFICLNSGSECVSLALRIADVDARRMTSASGPHNGRPSCLISLKGSFHGRTERPAQASDSTRKIYQRYLKSFKGSTPPLYTVTPNDVDELHRIFEQVEEEGLHVEAMLMEPVMGEGNPGMAITREFYDAARQLTDKYRSLLLVDSIQAGLRARGTLSIMDYPGFQDAAPPDFETFSKALNGGQFPLSVLALGPRVEEIYARGLYGNTMTTNPRALDVAVSILESITPEIRANIVEQGKNMVASFDRLVERYPDVFTHTSGTGLLNAIELNPQFPAFGHPRAFEVLCRELGLGVIHGGQNALRFTPVFNISKDEVDLVTEVIDEAVPLARQHLKDGDYANANSH